MRTPTITATGIAALLLAGGAMIVAPPAGADIGDFFAHVENVGIISTAEAGLESVAQKICADLYNGVPGESEAATIYAQSVNASGAKGPSMQQARLIVGFAQQDVCPGAPAPVLLYAPQVPSYVPPSYVPPSYDNGCDFQCRVARDHWNAITDNGTFMGPG